MTEFDLWAKTPSKKFSDENVKRFDAALKTITIPEVQQFVVFAVMRKGDEDTLRDALDIHEMLVDYLTQRHQYNPLMPSKMTDAIFAAALIHNIWFNPSKDTVDDWLKVYYARENLTKLASEFIVMNRSTADGLFDYVFQIVEAQLGEQMPVAACRPMTGNMTYVLWETIWLYHRYVKKDAA